MLVRPLTNARLPRIVGRPSSHFTRLVRMLAAECGVACEFERVADLFSDDVAAYGGNPGLRLPNLVTSNGTVFGALNSCRVLSDLATHPVLILWPEGVVQGPAANAQELTLQAMSTEVTLIMSSSSNAEPSPYVHKLRQALDNMLVWLDTNVTNALDALPPRDVSYFELALFCLLDHLEFREVATLARHSHLRDFRDRYRQRPSARLTPFTF